MSRPVYIKSATAISPQYSFEAERFLQPVAGSDNGQLYVIDADYRQYINPVAIRRMSRLLKMSISAAMQCLKEAGVVVPDAVITGSGRGSMTDMELFLKDLIRLQEEALNPTLFIQSTYNAPNGWIALQTKGTGYNQTYVHRGISMELALLDAQLLLEENPDQNILVGCYDELTPEYMIIKGKLDYWKKKIPVSTELLQHADTPGTIAGEGTAFFTLCGDADGACCAVRGIRTISAPDAAAVEAAVQQVVSDNGLAASDIDVVLCGMNGDARFQSLYAPVSNYFAGRATIAAFKHLCGEYDTTTGFALWLAAQIMRTQQVPEPAVVQKGTGNDIQHLLIVNHYILGSASVLLVSRSL